MTRPNIPIIDIDPIHAGSDDLVEVGAALAEACHSVGFCYLANHGVTASLEADALAATRDFFALDPEAKARLSMAQSPHFRGYTPLGAERTRGHADWREQLDLGLDEPVEETSPGDPAWRRLRGPNQWPAELPALQRVISAWSAAMQPLAVNVMRALAVGLEQPAHVFDDYLLPRGDPHLKLIRYEGKGNVDDLSAASADHGDPGQGVGWHTDSGLLSFILQDQTGGLEIRTESGVLAAHAVPGTYLVNVGEMLQRASGGYLRATEHRVVSPPAGCERISLAYFPHPRFEVCIEPLPLSPVLARRARAAFDGDETNRIHRCFGENYLKIRLRSHPDVAAHFYADVVEGARAPV